MANIIKDLIEANSPSCGQDVLTANLITNKALAQELVHDLYHTLLTHVLQLDEERCFTSYGKQLAIAFKLHAFGLEKEATAVMKYVGDSIQEMNPAWGAWFAEETASFHSATADQFQEFIREAYQPKISVLEPVMDSQDNVLVDYYEGDTEHRAKIQAGDFMNYAVQMMRNSVTDTCDHEGGHVQRTYAGAKHKAQHIMSFMQANMQTIAERYIIEGMPFTKVY
jgi:hypothetical protein